MSNTEPNNPMRRVWKVCWPGGSSETMTVVGPIRHIVHFDRDPENARIHKSGDFEPGLPCVWFEYDDDLPEQTVELRIVGTGHPIPSGTESEVWAHVGSCVVPGYAWHLYRRVSSTSLIVQAAIEL